MKFTVCYATDENYVKLTAVSLYSLLSHNPGIDITVLASDISVESEELLTGTAARFNSALRIIDVEKELEQLRLQNAPGYTSYSTYSRHFAPQLLQQHYDRILYLDCDTIVTGNIVELLNLPLRGRPFAIGYDCLYNNYKRFIGLSPEQPYFNAGVLLIDIQIWIAQECTARFFDCIKNRVNQPSILADQDILAHSLARDAAILPPQYNFLTHFQMFKTRNDVLRATGIPASAWYTEAQYSAAREKPVIHHFLGHTLGRPWYKESLNPLRPLYRKLAAEAGVPEVAEQSRPVDFGYKVQHLTWKTLPPRLFAYACRAMYAYFFKTRYGV